MAAASGTDERPAHSPIRVQRGQLGAEQSRAGRVLCFFGFSARV